MHGKFGMYKVHLNGLIEPSTRIIFFSKEEGQSAVPCLSTSAFDKVPHELEFWGSDVKLEALESEQTASRVSDDNSKTVNFGFAHALHNYALEARPHHDYNRMCPMVHVGPLAPSC